MSSTSSSSRPSSPTKPGNPLDFKPNPHPYAIKTTSTGLLSRSATTASSISHSHNHYVPLSPSPSPTKQSSRPSRHRYSRSLTDDSPRPLPPPPDDPVFYSRGQRVRAETLPALESNLDIAVGPKQWSPEQLAAHIPEIATFVEEHEITGRAFLRFDEGVLDAYGVTEQWQRSLILSASRNLRQSVLKERIWPSGDDFSTPNNTTRRPHNNGSAASSPSKPSALPLPHYDDEDDEAYLSSSSSVSSTSSLSGVRKRKYRPNSRVHGMVASIDRRERSGSTSSVDNEPDGTYGRPLPLPQQQPLLLPTRPGAPASSFSFHAPPEDAFATPHATGNGVIYDPPQQYQPQRPLPSPPPPLFHPPKSTEDKDQSDEMSSDQLLALLNGPPGVRGGAAWELEANVGETVKRAPKGGETVVGEDTDMTVEELLALETGSGGRVGAAAWVEDIQLGETARRVPIEKEVIRDELVTGRTGGRSRRKPPLQRRKVAELFSGDEESKVIGVDNITEDRRGEGTADAAQPAVVKSEVQEPVQASPEHTAPDDDHERASALAQALVAQHEARAEEERTQEIARLAAELATKQEARAEEERMKDIARLEAELAETRRLAEVLRERVVGVESRVGAMEIRSQESEARAQAMKRLRFQTQAGVRYRMQELWRAFMGLGSAFAGLGGAFVGLSRGVLVFPLGVGLAIPRFAVLFGIGICAAVLRSVGGRGWIRAAVGAGVGAGRTRR